MDDDLIWSRQNYQKRCLYDQQKDDYISLKRVSERLEDSCQSEQLTTNNRKGNYIDINNMSQFAIPSFNQTTENGIGGLKTNQQSPDKSFTQQILSPNISNVSNTKEVNFNILKDVTLNSRPIESQDQAQYTFNDEQIKGPQSQKHLIQAQPTTQKEPAKLQHSKTKIGGGFQGSTKLAFMRNDFQILTQARKKMMEFFFSKTFSGRNHQLKNKQIQLHINDLCDITHDSNQGILLSLYLLFFQLVRLSKLNFFKFIPIFNPQHPLIFFLNIFSCIFNCCFYTFLSVVVVFGAVIPKTTYGPIFALWIFEILLKLNTFIYLKTEQIKDRQVILAMYLKKNAIYDVIPFISLLLLLLQQSISQPLLIVLHICSFIKLKNIIEELSLVQKQICMAIQKYYYIIQLINLIIKLFLLAHVIACMWYLIGQVELYLLDEEQTWYSDSIGSDGTWWKLYLSSFYWSLTLMATGSNIATTSLQMFFTSFIMLFTTIMFGYFLQIIGFILSENDEEEINQRKDINIINKYMRKRNISKQIHLLFNSQLIF